MRATFGLALAFVLAGTVVFAEPPASPTFPCSRGAICGQKPDAGPVLVAAPDPEDQAALAELKEILSRRGYQIAYRERVNRDGTRTPELVVERVYYFIALPERGGGR